MTLIELFVFMFFVGGGAFGGANVASMIRPGDRWLGPIIGAAVGGGMLALITYVIAHAHPPCRCGRKHEKNFRYVEDPRWGWVEECACGLRYHMRKGRLWFELLPEADEPRLYLRCDFWGRWRD